MEEKRMVEAAIQARENAYVPYSHFSVGAALLTKSGKLYTGCNIESASYTPTNCAERTAFFKAVSEGEKEFSSIAIVGGPSDEPVNTLCSPCGVCRQVMMEFCDPKTFRILLASGENEWKSYTLEELLPLSFGPDNL